VGGDVVDEAIAEAVTSKVPALLPHKTHLLTWARSSKPRLFDEGELDLDPDLDLNLSHLGTAVRVRLPDAAAGIAALASGVRDVVVQALDAADNVLLDAKERGTTTWPAAADILQVWYFGGSSVVPQVRAAIDAALTSRNVRVSAVPLPLPNRYSGWNEENYRKMACAAGASRPELSHPPHLRPGDALPFGNSPFDKD
jgi:hypothetical protein